MNVFRGVSAGAICLLMVVGFAESQSHKSMKMAEPSDAQYIKEATSAAPAAIGKDAGVVRMDKDGKMASLRESKNGFTCMMALGSPMCADANSMAFFDAWMKHENPPDKLGVTYMLRGDDGASNTDPGAMAKTADNHWVVTGPHIMIVGPGAKTLGLTEAADPDPTKPYMMWAGTPYEHAMIPVAARPAASTKPAAKVEKK